MSLPPVVTRWFQSFKRFCNKYESIISVLFTVLPVIGKLVSKTIIQRVAVALLGLSAVGLVGIAQQEDFRGKAYMPTPVDVPTVGFGSTKGVHMGDTITPVRALVRLLAEVEDEYGAAVKRCVKSPLYQHEYDVYTRVTYNIGTTAFCNSTMVKRLNAEDYAGACSAIKLFNKQKGKVLRGLVNLREQQYNECMREPNV